MSEKFTTAGSLLLKHAMPTPEAKAAFDIYRPLDKPGVESMVNMLLQHGGHEAFEHINNLGKLFFNTATEIGASTPMSDYINDSDERNAIIAEYDTKVQKILHSTASKQEQNSQLSELTGAYNTKINKQNLQYLLSKGSTAAKMANTGARGNPSQLASGTSTPLMSSNVKGELIPVVIKRSFAEGMRPAEQIALSYMGRGSTVLSQLSTALPGALFKKLSPTVFHEVITEEDCHTHNGIFVPISDTKRIIGRYDAESNRLIDESFYKDLKASNVSKAKVRSAMTCEAHEGVCQHCYGLMANARLPEIGTNIGVIAAQSVSEVLTQSMLSTKHKTTVGERKGNAYEQAANLMNNPAENFKDEATIASLNGVVSDIKQTPLGDTHVFINEKMHFVPISQRLKVSKGDKVQSGQALSTGTINPRNLVNLRGIGAGRTYMADELRDIYGGNLDPRHFEIISKNLIKYVQIVSPGETGFLPGEKVDVNAVAKYLNRHAKEVPLDRAEGTVLSRGVGSLTPGTLLDAHHIEDLKEAGVTEVSITDTGLRVKPIVPGLQTAKLLDKNWVSKLSFNHLKDTLKDSTAIGAESEVHSTDPITSYMFGNEFGEGQHGKY